MRHPRRRPTDARIDALLRDVSAVRLTLDADLTIAAAAAEMDRIDVAAELVDFDRDELAAFTARALGHLEEAPQPAHVVAATPKHAEQRGPWRHRITLAAAPAMLAAAAAVALFTGTVKAPDQSPQGVTRTDLVASYTAFSQLAVSGKDPAGLAAQFHQLNRSVATLIAAAAHDPASALQALRILEAEQFLLTEHHPTGSVGMLAEARALVRRLQQTVPSSALTVARAPVASAPPADVLTVVIPSAAAAPAQPTAAPIPAATHSPPPAAAAEATPTPEPTSGDATVPPQPSPSPTLFDPWPFGNNT